MLRTVLLAEFREQVFLFIADHLPDFILTVFGHCFGSSGCPGFSGAWHASRKARPNVVKETYVSLEPK